MSFARVNGLVVHYLDEGPREAPTLCFANALGSDLRIWDEVAGLLAHDFRLVRYDTRGHGLSELGPQTNEVADYARDLAALLARLGVARSIIVGISMGGLIAQELYRLRPDLVAALVLCDTAGRIGDDASWETRMAEVERGGVEVIADALLLRWFSAAFRAHRSDDVAGWRAMLTRTPKPGYLAACGAIKRADLRPHAGLIEVPTLCLVGEEDGSTPVALVRDTAALIRNARFEVIEGAGHLPCIDQPAILARLIAEHSGQVAR